MIELIFSSSGAASLGLAKATGDKSQIMGVDISGILMAMKRLPILYVVKSYTGLKISGDISDVVPIWLLAESGISLRLLM